MSPQHGLSRDTIFRAEEQAERIKAEYLRERGWVHTCDLPGSVWLWTKALPDKGTVYLNMDQALHMEYVLHAWQGEEGYGA